MARTRTTRRTTGTAKSPRAMTTESPTTFSTAVTENASELGSTQASVGFSHSSEGDDKDENELSNVESGDEEEDTSVGHLEEKKKPSKHHISSDNDEDDQMEEEEEDLDNDNPVIIPDETEKEEPSDDEEVLFLGTNKPRPGTKNLKGNANRNVTMTYCVGNVFFGKAMAHFMFVSNGFDSTGTPRVNFRCYCLSLWIDNGKWTISITVFENWMFLNQILLSSSLPRRNSLV
jgi:hypothetical protein